jgi:hypothetical protein
MAPSSRSNSSFTALWHLQEYSFNPLRSRRRIKSRGYSISPSIFRLLRFNSPACHTPRTIRRIAAVSASGLWHENRSLGVITPRANENPISIMTFEPFYLLFRLSCSRTSHRNASRFEIRRRFGFGETLRLLSDHR